MSRFGLFDLARDATLAVGAYVGILREHVKGEWATVLGGSFDERVEEAKARMEARADALNEHEAENDGLDAEPLQWCGMCGHLVIADARGGHCHRCDCRSHSSSTGGPRKGAVGEPPEVEPCPPTAPSGAQLTHEPELNSSERFAVRQLIRQRFGNV